MIHPIDKSDVEWLLGTLSREDHEECEQPWFRADCHRKFCLLDVHRRGLLSAEELGRAAFVDMFPTLQIDLIDGERRIQSLASSIPSLIAALDGDSDGRLSEAEFLQLAKVCQAWRLRQYYSTGQMLGRKSSRPPALPRKGLAASGRLPGRPNLGLQLRPPSRQSSESRTSAASRQSSVSADSSSAPSRPPSERRRGAEELPGPGPGPLGPGPLGPGPLGPGGRGPLAALPLEALQQQAGAKRRGRSRPGSQASQASQGSRPSSRGSSRGSEGGRGRPKARPGLSQEALQLEAFQALVEHTLQLSRAATLGDAVHSLVQHCLTRENAPAFSRDAVHRAARAVLAELAAGSEAAESGRGGAPEAGAEAGGGGTPLAGSTLPASSSRARRPPSTEPAPRSSRASGSRPSSASKGPDEVVEVSPTAVLKVLQVLVEEHGLVLSDILGQVLFRHRRSEPLQGSQHRATAEDTSWVDGQDSLREVYRACTRKDHGRMRRSQWLKIVHLIQRNPVLRTKVRHADADRIFYSLTTRNKDPNRTVNMNEFLQLLLMLIETSGLHPWMIFFSVGAHARHLAAEAEGGRA